MKKSHSFDIGEISLPHATNTILMDYENISQECHTVNGERRLSNQDDNFSEESEKKFNEGKNGEKGGITTFKYVMNKKGEGFNA